MGVAVLFVHATPMLSYTLCRVNYEPCSLLAYFLAVDQIRILATDETQPPSLDLDRSVVPAQQKQEVPSTA